MFNTKIQKWINGNQFMAVEHTGQSQGNLLSFLILKNKNNTLSILQSGTVKSIKDLIEKIPKKIALSIVINNDKVLTKVINSSLSKEELVTEAFPTIKLSDFYYEVAQSNTLSVVSVCRKSDVDSILSEYKKNKLQVISFSLGNTTIFELEKYINDDNVQTTNMSISFDENGISKIENGTNINIETYLINDLKLSNNQLLPLGSVLKIISKNTTHNNYNSMLIELGDLYRQQRIFTNGVQLGLGFLFVLLLGNMLLFSLYQAKIIDKKQENNTNIQTKKELLNIEKELSIQKKLLKEMFQSSGTHTTYILNDLVSIIPQSILLNTLHYQPILKKIKPNKEIRINKNNLIIEGTSISDYEFTNWINQLEQKPWSDSVVILGYGLKKNTTNFKIQIHISDEWKGEK